MHNSHIKIAYLKATLNNKLTITITCEKVNSFHKTFLLGMVYTTKYIVSIISPATKCSPSITRKRTYTARWWWRFISPEQSRAAITIHLLLIKAKLKLSGIRFAR